MEDAHITIPNLLEDPACEKQLLTVFEAVQQADSEKKQPPLALFGVFDGHGGKKNLF